MTFGKRLAEERKKQKITQEQLGEKLGVALQTVSRWEKDQSPMPSDKISLLIDLDFDTHYIFTGEHPMSPKQAEETINTLKKEHPEVYNYGRNGKPTEQEERMYSYWTQLQDAKSELRELKEKMGDIARLNNVKTNKNNQVEKTLGDVAHFEIRNSITIDINDYAWIPLYNVKVSAGFGTFANNENILTWLSFSKYSLSKRRLSANDLCAVIVHGDSMADTLKPNDCIIINLTKRDADGGIFVIRVGETIYVKRLIQEKDIIRVISDNPRYDTWSLDKTDDFEIIGKYEWLGRYAEG